MNHSELPMTICYKKLRRHNNTDIRYDYIPAGEDESGKGTAVPRCKHCGENPYGPTTQEADED